LPTIDIDGRGKTAKEAIQDMWQRIAPLEDEGYNVVSPVEVVDARTNTVVESFQVTDPQWASLRSEAPPAEAKNPRQEHRPPTAHEFPFKARVKLQR
jgi:hypothetical protein